MKVSDTQGPRVADRAPEVSDFLQRPAHVGARYGTLIILAILSVLAVGAATYRYPTRMVGRVEFAFGEDPVLLSSSTLISRPVYLVQDGDQVAAQQTLVVSQAGQAALGHVLFLEDQLYALQANSSSVEEAASQLNPMPNLRVEPMASQLRQALSVGQELSSGNGQSSATDRLEPQWSQLIATLSASVEAWKAAHTVVSPRGGTISKTGKDGDLIPGETVFSLQPSMGEVEGSLRLPHRPRIPIAVGQPVLLAFVGWPVGAYGHVPGHISATGREAGGAGYLKVRVPSRVVTTKGIEIDAQGVIEATATLIVEERTLLQRLTGSD